jgi:hypothetical protein
MGGWPADRDYVGVVWCDFTGIPTLNLESGTSKYVLGPNETARVEVGDLFDETGVNANDYGELGSGSQYVIRIQAIATPEYVESYYSSTQSFTTLTVTTQNCTFTQGFWKTHGPAGCVTGNNSNTWPVNNLSLGTVSYTDLELCSIFNTPAAGNGLISLAHQLITAKLNIANGASAPASVLTAIINADALIGGLVCPPVGGGFLAPGSTSSLTNTLDQFNNGITGPGHCTTTPAQETTWGGLKLRYR